MDSESDPFNLTNDQWQVIIRNNSLLNGFAVKQGAAQIGRARFTVFSIRADALESGLFPTFDILDDSSISVAEVNNELQFASVKNYFNAEEVEAALSLKVMKFAVVGSLEASNRSSATEKSAVSTSVKRLYASYNFPRLSLYLDEDVLEPSPLCKSALLKLKETGDIKEMQKFFDRFGHFFSKEIQLGGVMQCTCSMDQVQGENVAEKTNSLRHAAGSLFSGFGAQAGLAAASESVHSRIEGLSLSGSRQNLVWEARGGDTLLTSQPTAWAPTVKNYTNWRAIKRTNVEPLHLLIGRMPGWEWVPDLFERLTPALKEEPTPDAPDTTCVELTTPKSIASDSSFAIAELAEYPRKDVTTYIILFQDAEGWIRAAGVLSPHEVAELERTEAVGCDDKAILFQDRIAEGRPHTPLAVTACSIPASAQQQGNEITAVMIEVFYLDKRGFIAEMEFNRTTRSWSPGPLNAHSAVFDKPHQMTSLAASCTSGGLRVDLFYGSEGHSLLWLTRRGDAWARVTNAGFPPRSLATGSPLSIEHDGEDLWLYAMESLNRVREYHFLEKDAIAHPPTFHGLEAELPLSVLGSDCRQFEKRDSPVEPGEFFVVLNKFIHLFTKSGGTGINIFCRLSTGSAEWKLISTRRDAKFVAIETPDSGHLNLERRFKVVFRKDSDDFAFRIITVRATLRKTIRSELRLCLQENLAEQFQVHTPPDVLTSFASFFRGGVAL